MVSIILRGDFLNYAFPHYNVPIQKRIEFEKSYLPKYLETLRAHSSGAENSQGDTFVFEYKSDSEALAALHLCLAHHQKP